MDILIFLILVPIIKTVTPILMLSAPIVVILACYALLRRIDLKRKYALILPCSLVFGLIAWPITGLISLNDRCAHHSEAQINTEKIGPIDTLLIHGRGMAWLKDRIELEFQEDLEEYGIPSRFYRKEINKEGKPLLRLVASQLRSNYKITIQRPIETGFFARYLTSAPILVEERSSGKALARVDEWAWGGGIIGSYISLFLNINSFPSRYLSCG